MDHSFDHYPHTLSVTGKADVGFRTPGTRMQGSGLEFRV